MNISRWMVGFLFVVVTAPVAFAGETPSQPQPTGEHKELGMWVGWWEGKGEMKSGPMGPGGPMSWTETCSWFGGTEFHVVCKSEGTSPMGPMKGLGIMGYNAEKKVYTHYGVDSTGWAGYSEGTRDGSSWTFVSEETMGGKTFQSRFTLTMASPKKMTFVWQTSEDGTSWTTMMDGPSEKK